MPKDKKDTDIGQKRRQLIAFSAIAFFILIVALITFAISKKFDDIAGDPQVFRNWIENFGFFGWLAFIFLAALQVIFAVIPGGPVQIAAGYAFGIIEGSILCTIGIQLGSAIAFLLARLLGTKVISLFFDTQKINEIKFLQYSKRLDLIVFICFLIPGAPKDLLTYFCGITKLPFKRFLVLTTFARIPSIVISVISGNALIKENYIFALIIMGALILCSLAGFFIYQKMMDKEEKKASESKEKQ